MHKQQENSLHFEDMMYSRFYFPQNAIYFVILFFLFK